jgi:hypothetical protein
MDQNEIEQIKQKQDEMFVLVQKLWRAEKWRRVTGMIKLLIWIALIVGSYLALQPLLDTFLPIFQQLQQIQSLPQLP